MTVILGYISEENIDNNSMLLASDDRIVRHYNNNIDVPINNYNKIFRLNNLLISFNGEVSFYEAFKNAIQTHNINLNNIYDLQVEINKVFPFNQFLHNRQKNAKARYSNIIVLDIEKRILANHYAGNVFIPASFFYPFRFDELKRNVLYGFGSFTSFLNDAGKSEEFNEINKTFTKTSTADIIQFCKAELSVINQTSPGIGNLHSYYIVDSNGIPATNAIETI